ncbi:MAG: quinolinate synthase NadA [Anaerolineae bacterium]|jgi:quinolinate synthase|nr:quinolinate synthase NadA [Anaerolineae bacterium]
MSENNSLEALLEAAKPLIALGIAEDIGPGDATSQATLKPATLLRGTLRAKVPGVIAGLPVAEAVLHQVDPTLVFTPHVADGQEVTAGELVAEVVGHGASLLAAERLVLNFMQRMSGIATLTRAYVDAVATTGATILDTRKTVPGYRVLDKYAVRMGGGVNHRMSLFDMLMVKDNHIDSSGGITQAVARARAQHPTLAIEVEVRTLEELAEALEIDPPLDRILLDNMSNETMRRAVTLTAGRVPLEASGNVNLETVAGIAATGVNFISVGALTHSVHALDLSLKVKPYAAPEIPAPEESLQTHIRKAKEALGSQLFVLGHHYQRDEILEFADARGDSLELSRKAAQTDARYIVFCGVHFMAETASILAKPGQHVLIPDITAGCYLAETANLEAVQAAWGALDAAFDSAEAEFTPITYVNSSAELKAFCGRHGGIVCTSGNAESVLRWAFAQKPRVFFFPDQHLGRNTALKMGLSPEEILLWDLDALPKVKRLQQAKVILWPGACNVHQRFRPEHVEAVRARYPGIRVIVHPECKAEVVALADEAGSTSVIIKRLEAATAGSQWAIGTESRLVQRLQHEHPDKRVISLADVPPFCIMMGQITLRNLARVVEKLAQGELYNEVTVEEETARWAKVALERMLAL